MPRYQICVEVKITACDAAVAAHPVEQAEGSFRLVISEQTASSIDECEQALLRTNYAAVRQALGAHLSALSKKKPANGRHEKGAK
jgi:alpha/beta superfamily hydrolase